MCTALMAILALYATPQEVERGATWYWPVGSPFGCHAVRQAYGQLETIPAAGSGAILDQVHEGLDVAATPGAPVAAPFAGKVFRAQSYGGTYAHYGTVWIARDGADWLLTVTHLAGITVAEGDTVAAGQLLGEVADWPDPDGFDHAHLGLLAIEPYETSGDYRYLTGALPFLGGHVDLLSPVFREIELEDGARLHPVAFVKDDPSGGAELEFFEDTGALPEGELDVLARIDDWLAPSATVAITIVLPWPFGTPITITIRLPSTWFYPVTTPGHVSLRITRLSDGVVVCENALDFTRSLTDENNNAYRRATGGSGHVTRGWPYGPFYFLLTNSHEANGSWKAKTGKYLVEVAVEDLAGNQDHQVVNVEVK